MDEISFDDMIYILRMKEHCHKALGWKICGAIADKLEEQAARLEKRAELAKRMRWAAERLTNKFSVNDELFQLLTEAAEALDPEGRQ